MMENQLLLKRGLDKNQSFVTRIGVIISNTALEFTKYHIQIGLNLGSLGHSLELALKKEKPTRKLQHWLR